MTLLPINMLTSSRSLKTRYSGVTMAEGVCSSSAHGGFEVSSLVDSCSEISESDSVSEASLLLRMKVEPYLFELEHSPGESDIAGEIEDSVEMDPFHAVWVGNDNWCAH